MLNSRFCAFLATVVAAGMAGGYTKSTFVSSSTTYNAYTGAGNETLDIGLIGNAPTDCYYLGAGDSIKLSGTVAADGGFELNATITAYPADNNVSFVVDASGLEGCTYIRWLGHLRTLGTVTLKGVGKVVFGEKNKQTSLSVTNLRDFELGDFAFSEVTDPVGVVFTNGVTITKLPSCAWSIAKGTYFAPIGDDKHFGEKGKELVVKDYNLIIAGTDIFDASSLRLQETCGFRPCRPASELGYKDKRDFWTWGGFAGTFKLPIVLDGESVELQMQATQEPTLAGKISGNGSIRTCNGSATWVALNGDLEDFKGSVLLDASKAGLRVGGPYLHRLEYKKSSVANPSEMRPDGFGKRSTTARIDAVKGLSESGNVISVPAFQTLTIGELTGALKLVGDVTSLVVVENLADGTKLCLSGGVRLEVRNPASGVTVTLDGEGGATGSWGLFGPALGDPFSPELVVVSKGGSLTVGGQVDLGSLGSDIANLTVESGNVKASLSDEVALKFRGGTLVRTPAWQDKIALWCDAQATRTLEDGVTVTNTFVYGWEIPSFNPETQSSKVWKNGKPTIWRWLDCRPTQRRYEFRNKRFEKATDDYFDTNVGVIFPLEDRMGNGLPFVTMSTDNNHFNIRDNDLSKNQNTAAIRTVYAIVVFGGQNGGGGALLGTQNGELARKALSSSATGNLSALNITTNAYSAYQDGDAIDTSGTKFKPGWQIISIDLGEEGLDIDGIGFGSNGSNATPSGRGYSNYAEVMLFAEKPTETERMMIEEYLSEKWQVEVSHADTIATQKITGQGNLSLSQSTLFQGVFDGTVDLNGRRLALADGRAPMTAAEMPTQNRTLWIDPTVAGSVLMSQDSEKPLEIKAILQRNNAGGVETSDGKAYLQSAIKADGSLDRRPHVAAGSRGGAAATWIDFADIYTIATDNGNGLQVTSCPVHDPYPDVADDKDGQTYSWNSLGFCTLFVVTDTSRGGGSVVTSWAGGSGGDIRLRGKSPKVTDPIWATDCTALVQNGTNWLDGVERAIAEGFNGRPEVLTTELAGSTSVKTFGCYNTGSELNEELLGEIIAFNRPLGDEERSMIEAYLMYKWLGTAKDGYVDFRNMTVTGAGELLVPTAAGMPKLAEGFTGTVIVTNETLTATFAETSFVATDALDVGAHALTLPTTVTVNLSFASRVKGDRPYTILVGDLKSDTAFVVGTVTGGGSRAAEGAFAYDAEAKAVTYTVPKVGSFILLR